MPELEIIGAGDDLDHRTFHEALDTLAGPLFAVLDGAHFDDVEDELADLGIQSRSLFLRGGSEAMRRDGPWLVKLEEEKTRTHVVELALAKPCAVFWSCANGGNALWQHLRTINEIWVPDDRGAGNTAGDTPVHYERVLFRHWDPNVIGSFLPKLRPEHLARIFGPADAIIVNAANYGGFKRATRPGNLPPAPRGLLKLDPTDIRSIEDARYDHRSDGLCRYLRNAAPNHTRHMTDEELRVLSKRHMQEAATYGIVSEASTGRWCYMQVVSGGQFGAMPEVRALMKDKSNTFSPDDRITHLMTILAMKLKEAR